LAFRGLPFPAGLDRCDVLGGQGAAHTRRSNAQRIAAARSA
jgi:hypothetical protein